MSKAFNCNTRLSKAKVVFQYVEDSRNPLLELANAILRNVPTPTHTAVRTKYSQHVPLLSLPKFVSLYSSETNYAKNNSLLVRLFAFDRGGSQPNGITGGLECT